MKETRQIERFVATGRVQGVGFRMFVAREASRLNLSGWVRNLGRNQVEVVAAGETAALDQLAVLAQRGPSAARVDVFFRGPADEASLARGNEAGLGMAVAPSA